MTATKPTYDELLDRVAELEQQLGQHSHPANAPAAATEATLNTEDKFQLVFEGTGDAIFIHDAGGQILAVNGMACEHFGYTRAELMSMTVGQVDAPEGAQHSPGRVARLLAQGSVSFEAVHRRKDDSLVPVDVRARRITWEGQPAVLSMARDIIERKRAEAALRKREEEFEKLTSRVPGMVYQFTRRPNGSYRVPFTTEAIRDIFGCSPRDVREDFSPIVAAILPEDRGMVLASIGASAQQMAPWRCEYRVKLSGQAIRWMLGNSLPERDPDGSITWYGFNTDITERKHAEEALRDSEERYRTLVNNAPLGIILADHDGTIREVNPEIVKILGSPSAAATMAINVLSFPALVESGIADDFRRCIETGERTFGEHWYQTAWRKATCLRYHMRAILDAEGQCQRVQAVVEDISALRLVEQEKATLEVRLQRAEKMESVGRLVGGIAHDFNNMLSVILSNVGFALENLALPAPVRADLLDAKTAAKRSAELVRQLLAFASRQTISPIVLDLNEVVEGMLAMLRRLIGEDVDLVWTPGKGRRAVRVDPSQIDQILANLCANARDALADVGQVTIETGVCTLDAGYCVSHAGDLNSAGEYVRLTVSDTGGGIDKDTLEHIFEPFFTTKGVGKGTGLGLATVYGIVKQNNGFIDVASEPGHGTKVTIYLPQHDAKTTQMRSLVPGPMVRGHETILVVEDAPAILRAVKRMLDQQGYVVLAASSAGEAIRLAREHAGEIHLLVTDVVMPEMNGRDLARNLLTLYPAIKRLFMSGYTANVVAHRGVLDDGVHYLQKPFTPEELAANVRDALDAK